MSNRRPSTLTIESPPITHFPEARRLVASALPPIVASAPGSIGNTGRNFFIAPVYNQWFITLPASALRKGRNTVIVAYTREHSTNGEGLHRFKDPTDGKVYLYSHFEPAAAHQMFAGFDQPDLKARTR